jgi:hypothetical protein
MGLAMSAHARAIAVLLLGALGVCGCATAPPRLPSGGNDDVTLGPDSDSVGQALFDSLNACRSPIVTARALVRGTLDRRRIDAAFWVGFDTTISRVGGVEAATSRVRLESMDTRSPRFAMLASYSFGSDRKDDATLLLSDARWVVRSRSRELVELVLGLPVSAIELKSLLTGCLVPTGGFKIERSDANTLKVILESGDAAIDVFIRRHGVVSPWAVFAMIGSVPGRPIRWRADLGERSHGVLESVRVTVPEWNSRSARQFDLTVSFDHIETPALAADVLSLPVPDSAETIPIVAVRLNLSLPLLAH